MTYGVLNQKIISSFFLIVLNNLFYMQSLFITFYLLLLFLYCYICHIVLMSVMYLSVSYMYTTMGPQWK